MWTALCAEGQKHRGLCAGTRCKAQLHRESHCWALTVQLSGASPSSHGFGAHPALSQIIGARNTDPQAGPRLSTPSPSASLLSNPRTCLVPYSVVIIFHFQGTDCREGLWFRCGAAQPRLFRVPSALSLFQMSIPVKYHPFHGAPSSLSWAAAP